MVARAGTSERASEINSGLMAGSRSAEQVLWKELREEGLERDGRRRLGLGRRVGPERHPSA